MHVEMRVVMHGVGCFSFSRIEMSNPFIPTGSIWEWERLNRGPERGIGWNWTEWQLMILLSIAELVNQAGERASHFLVNTIPLYSWIEPNKLVQTRDWLAPSHQGEACMITYPHPLKRLPEHTHCQQMLHNYPLFLKAIFSVIGLVRGTKYL